MDNNTERDNRHYSRIRFNADTQLIDDNGRWDCHLVDISVKGALVEPTQNMECNLGKSVRLEIRLTDSDVVIQMGLTVAHITGNRVGLNCNEIDAESMTHLRRLMELNAGDPDLFNREVLHLG